MSVDSPLDGVPGPIVDRFRLDRLPFDRPTVATSDLLRLDGTVALVTGGGGTGLGDAICHRLAEQGAAVAVVDRSLSAAEATASALRGRWKVNAAGIEADVRDWDACHAATAEAEETLGPVDLLVTNAGGGYDTIGTRFVDLTREQMMSVVELNFLGVLQSTKAVLPGMVERRRGTIITITSESGMFGTSGILTYASCKAGIQRFSRSLAEEVGRDGVRVLSVSPGTIVAERNLDRMKDPSAAQLGPLDDSIARTSLDRCCLPDEVASVVAYLASPAGNYVHGTTISVSGGMTA